MLDSSRKQAALVGFTVTANIEQLAPPLLWHVVTEDGAGTIPADRQDAALGKHIAKVVAWLAAHQRQLPPARPRPPRGIGSGPARPTPPAQPPVIELRIGPHRAARPAVHAGGPVTAHVRRGHWRRQRVGPIDDWVYELRWIAPTFVNGVGPVDRRDRIFMLTI